MTRIEIYDTTLRDGSQAEGISFSLMDKLAITQRLDSIGVDYVEGGYPASNEKDAQYFQRVRELSLKHTCVCAFGMTRRKGVKATDDEGLRALLDSAAKTITIVGKSSLFQVGSILRATPEENLAMIGESVGFLVANGREVIFDAEHFFDGWKGDCSMMAAAVNAAAKTSGREVAFDVEQIVDDWKANAFYSLRPSAPRPRPARMVVLCDTNGGTHARGDCASGAMRREGRCPCRWASIATTTASWRWPIRWRPSMPARCKCKARSTALASAAATPT